MKKMLSLLLALALTLSLAACSAADVADILDLALDELEYLTAEEESGQEESAQEGEDSVSVTEPEETSAPDEEIQPEDLTESQGADSQSVEYVGGDFSLDEDGTYTTCEEVALYIVTYDHLPENFMTKEEARELGWNGGGLDDYAYGMCIGGDYFGNKEGVLPKAKGRTYHECDIDTLHANKRGAERIVYSNDGLVYYTEDHYETFTLLYGEE